MINGNTMFNVTNRSTGMVKYTLPNLGVTRTFAAGQTLKISFKELKELEYLPGGRTLMENFLLILSAEALDSLNIRPEPEYHLTEKEVNELLLNGTIEAFLDCLDFAPLGVIDLIKDRAIALPLNDVAKREALKEKTGFDVTKALDMKRQEIEDSESNKKTTTAPATGRRTVANYKTPEAE